MSAEHSQDAAPPRSPVEPVELRAESQFQFRCHPGIACFNACCKNIAVTLTPYDIIRLKRRLGVDAKTFVGDYTLPFELDAHGMPGLKLMTKPASTECVFLSEQGCTVYEDRPVACRYYALGNMGVRKSNATRVEDIYFLVREAHCLGHNEPQAQSVSEYRRQQGADVYDEHNRAWRELLLKKRSSGPSVGAPSPRSLQLFDMCSYDMDSFREFVASEGFRDIFELTEADRGALEGDDETLLRFSMRLLAQILFGERSLPMRSGARARRIERRKEVWSARKRRDAAAHREKLEEQKYAKN